MAKASPVRVEVLWTFHYYLTADAEKSLTKVIKNLDFGVACLEFHALMQLMDPKHGRDDYKITKVVSNHISSMRPTPQTYFEEDLPPRNPAVTRSMLAASLENRIYPKAKRLEGEEGGNE